VTKPPPSHKVTFRDGSDLSAAGVTVLEFAHMGRPRIGESVMTAAERQRRRRAKLAATIDPAQILAELERVYQRAVLADKDAIRKGAKKLLRQWERQEAARERWWRKNLRRR